MVDGHSSALLQVDSIVADGRLDVCDGAHWAFVMKKSQTPRLSDRDNCSDSSRQISCRRSLARRRSFLQRTLNATNNSWEAVLDLMFPKSQNFMAESF